MTGVKAPSKFMGAFGFVGFSGPGVPAWVAAKSTQLYAGPLIVKSRFQLLPARMLFLYKSTAITVHMVDIYVISDQRSSDVS